MGEEGSKVGHVCRRLSWTPARTKRQSNYNKYLNSSVNDMRRSHLVTDFRPQVKLDLNVFQLQSLTTHHQNYCKYGYNRLL